MFVTFLGYGGVLSCFSGCAVKGGRKIFVV